VYFYVQADEFVVFVVCRWQRWPIPICLGCWKVTRFRKHCDHRSKQCSQSGQELYWVLFENRKIHKMLGNYQVMMSSWTWSVFLNLSWMFICELNLVIFSLSRWTELVHVGFFRIVKYDQSTLKVIHYITLRHKQIRSKQFAHVENISVL